MHRNFKVFAAFSALLVAMCTFYDQSGAVVAPNGLSCQNRTTYGGIEGQPSAECYYPCPDGTGRQVVLEGEFSASSPLYSAPKGEADVRFCEDPALPVLTQPPATDSPAPTEAAPVPATEQILPTSTVEIILAEEALLRGDVTMCDVAIDLINFRMNAPVPGLVVEGLEVEIGDRPTSCSVNPTNTSLLTCTIPPGVSFPTRVLVRVDGAVANDFIYDGLGCAKIATEFPSTTP